MVSHGKKREKKKRKKEVKKNQPLDPLTSDERQQCDEPVQKRQKLEEVSQERSDSGDDQELSPEKRRILERKLKKQHKKEQKKLLKKAGAVAVKELIKPSGPRLALDYLTSWSENAKAWKFQKTRQTWLLLNMYDQDKVPDKYFSILLQYLEGLQGNARDVTVQKAEALMKEYDNSGAEDSALLEKCERIRKVLQLLS